ncbi:MAG TPA: ABC transporter permease [Candidatus Binatia bacterium]|nr:ABC transporter permease [Candidatus Binatia bacterium]
MRGTRPVIYKPGTSMVAQAIRELRRHAVRSTLTAGGIAIGVIALVLLGALSEKTSRLVQGGRDFGAGQITVSGAGANAATGMSRGALVSGEQLDAVRAVPGVAEVAPIVMFPLTESPALPFSLAPLAFGVDEELLARNRRAAAPRVRAGRLVPAAGSDEVVIGSQVAKRFDADVGSTIRVRGRDFRVVGVLEQTLTGPDSFVMMPFATAERLLLDSEPVLRRLTMVPGSQVLPIATAAAVFWKDGEDPEQVADRIRDQVQGLSVVSPKQAEAQIDRALAFLRGIINGGAIVALVVASLAVANTTFTAMVERRREIGLWRVVGATRRQLVSRLVLEAVLLAVAGSTIGLVAGLLATDSLNALTERLGSPVFLITARLVGAAALLPPMMAALAALPPVWRATRRPPTEAVRYA